MRKCIRVAVLALLGLLSTAVLGALTAVMAAVSLAATTALIVPGTGTPNANDVTNYMENFRDYYMRDTPCTAADGCGEYNDQDPQAGGLLGVNYFASFWPLPLPGWCDPGRCEKFDVSVADGVDNLREALQNIQNLDPEYNGDIVIAGYSQGARVVTIAKTQFVNGDWNDLLDQVDSVSFVFIGNPNRPNGGILSRFGILGTIPILDVTTGEPTPTGEPDYPKNFSTEDWAIRWEGIADFPQYLLNPLAVANSLLGFYYDHGTYLAINGGSDPGELPAGYDIDTWKAITANPELYPGIVDIQQYGDTTYYTVTPKVLPLVRPLHDIPLIGKPIADLIEPALRVIIEETGYNRDIPFGQPSEIGLFPLFNPVTLFFKLIPAIFQGVNNFLANFGLATEIPLSPTTPTGPPTSTPLTSLLAGLQQGDSEEDEPDLAQLAGNDVDGSSKVKLAVVKDDGSLEQQFVGEDTVAENAAIVDTATEGDPPLTEGAEGAETVVGEQTPIAGGEQTPVAEETVGPEGSQETVLEQQAPTADVTGAAQDGQEPATGNESAVVVGTKPDVKKEPETTKPTGTLNPAQNRLDANNRSASLNFSPNKPAESSTTSGVGAGEADPTAKPEPVESPEAPSGPAGAGPAGAESSEQKNSEPAAA
ncbi:PE-PPE domain-containing protein [Mycolicibacterium sp. GF69]|uniref:PE-PPE domain-containing protein n=1 Tax=Mycolicibacterium sp. GF69 TaxID=2267251 RepID=UPI000DCE1FA3|nr:PE-PPE domain-containing protein [Mycolicibacterium sp. GF69]RAV17048.1 PE-PPE domain-containing protein [Mycolicibacterium sp. GF69]